MSELLLTRQDFTLTPEGYIPAEPELLKGPHYPDEVDGDKLREVIREANGTYQVATDSEGRTHETVLFNADKLENGLVFKPSTSFSSGLKNPANLLETALVATVNPNTAFLYWGSWGNHPTGHMKASDRRYVRQTGRHTKGDGTSEHPYSALDPYKYLVEMLDEQGRSPTHFIADQEAGRLVLPLMVELGKDTIRGVYLNGIEGVSEGANYVSSSAVEDVKSRIRRRSIGEGKPGELTPANIKELKELMPDVYRGIGRIAHLAPLPIFLFPLDVRDKIGVTMGYKDHKDLSDLSDHAIYQDMSAALRNQNTTITMQFNRESSQHNIDDCIIFGGLVMNNIPEGLRTPSRGVRLHIGDGTLTRSTDKPHEATSAQRLGLTDIVNPMVAVALSTFSTRRNGQAKSVLTQAA